MQKLEERRGFGRAVEVEDDVVAVAHGLNAMATNSRLEADWGEAVERAFEVVKSLIGCSMCRVDMRPPFPRLALIQGVDTYELARLMFLSQHTVQDHLKSIFAKTSVHSRRTLVARVLGI